MNTIATLKSEEHGGIELFSNIPIGQLFETDRMGPGEQIAMKISETHALMAFTDPSWPYEPVQLSSTTLVRMLRLET